MISKIICPVDFSVAAVNAAEYAANLAQLFNARLLFVHVQQAFAVSSVASLAEGIDAGLQETSIEAAEKLKEMSLEANKMFAISSDYELNVTTQSFEKLFSDTEPGNTIIVMGTNGADDLFQFFFGTNTYQVIRKTKCPVLVIPENVSYTTIKKVVFSWDYNTGNTYSFTLFADLKTAFNPEFVFLHISKEQTVISQDVFRALSGEAEAVLGAAHNVVFEQQFSDTIPASINVFMHQSEADVLAITYYDRGVIGNIFHGTVAKDISVIADYPVLVLHGECRFRKHKM